ncbi:MAG TPA: hypothetical protein VGC82_07040, partial [Rhodopila sp.]
MTHTYDRDQTMPRRLAIVLTTLFLTSLVCLSLMTFDHVKYIALQARGHLSAETIRGALTVSDWGILCVTTALALALIALPAARKGFVTLWSKDTLLVWMPVGAALFWCGHAILGSGLIVTGDAGTHVARVNHLAMALRDGGSLFWDNYFFGGSTLLQFTGPVFHWTAALIDLAVEDPTQSIKFAAFCIRLIAALFMYLLMRGYGLSRTTGSLTALFYGGAFFMTYMEIVRSSFPQLINFAAMPAIIFFVERILAGRAVIGGGTAGLSLVAILFIGNHQPTALIFGLLVAIYVCIRLSMTGGNGATMVALAATAMFIAVGSVFFLLPFVLERGMTADDFSAASLITFAWPSVATLHDFVVWGSAGAGPVYAAYVGLPMLGCVAAGGYAIWTNSQTLERSLRSTWSLMLGLASISLFVRGAYVREATFTFFFLCVAAGVGLEMATRGHRRGSLLAAVFVTTLLDAGPLAVQPWTRRDFVPIAEAGEYLVDRARNARVVEVQQIDGKAYIAADPTLSPLAYGRLQILAGPHKQDATKAHNGFAALLKIAQQDLRTDGRLEPRTRNMLAVANVGWVVGTAAKGMGLPNNLEGTITDPVLGTYLPIPEATPFIVSGRLETMTRPMAFDV